jgi:hypothetical protein
MSQEKFSRIHKAVTEGRLFGTADFKKIFGIDEPLARQYVMAGFFRPDFEARGSGQANRFNICSVLKSAQHYRNCIPRHVAKCS